MIHEEARPKKIMLAQFFSCPMILEEWQNSFNSEQVIGTFLPIDVCQNSKQPVDKNLIEFALCNTQNTNKHNWGCSTLRGNLANKPITRARYLPTINEIDKAIAGKSARWKNLKSVNEIKFKIYWQIVKFVVEIWGRRREIHNNSFVSSNPKGETQTHRNTEKILSR